MELRCQRKGAVSYGLGALQIFFNALAFKSIKGRTSGNEHLVFRAQKVLRRFYKTNRDVFSQVKASAVTGAFGKFDSVAEREVHCYLSRSFLH